MPTTPREDFLASLLALADRSGTSAEELTEAFRAALLAYGSDTDDNRAAAGRLAVQDADGTTALALTPPGVPVADVLNAAEGGEVPSPVREAFPEIDQDGWDAALRVATLVMTALEARG
ncbi:hypothetical protein [Spirillospora sp. NPDC047279]|uniref:hypothetical protein n=1 Tax=Spirillospora sp. NPDC047279 TaxID=3155478 RepID=UPI0033EBC1BA